MVRAMVELAIDHDGRAPAASLHIHAIGGLRADSLAAHVGAGGIGSGDRLAMMLHRDAVGRGGSRQGEKDAHVGLLH